MEIGDKIKRYRQHLKLTQEEFAERIGSKKQHVSDMERDARNPSIDLLNNMITRFQIDARYFFGQLDDPKAADMSSRDGAAMTEMERLAASVEDLKKYVAPSSEVDPLANRVTIDAELRGICEILAYKDGAMKRRIKDRIIGWVEAIEETQSEKRGSA